MNKLALIFPCYYPAIQFGGPSIASKTFYMTLNKSLKISMITTDAGLSKEDAKIAQLDGVVIHILKFKPLERFGIFFSGYKNLFKIIKNNDYIYLRGIWCYITVVALVFSIILKKNLIVASTGKIPALSQIDLSKDNLKMRLKILFARFLLRSSKYIHYTSCNEYAASKLFLEMYSIKTKPIILPTAIPFDMDKFSYENDADKISDLNFLIMSRLTPIKNVNTSLKIFFNLLKKFPGSKLHVVGEFSNEIYKEECLNIINNSNMAESVRLHGQLERSSVFQILRDSHIFIQMSDSEGFSNSILEAQAAGLFLILSSGCNYMPNNKHGVIYDNANRIDDLVLEIKNRCDKASISQQAFDKYSIQTLANHYTSVIEGLND